MQVKHRFSHWCVARASCCLQMGMHSYTFYFMTNLFVNQFSELGRLSLQKSDKVTICVLIRAVIIKLSRFLRVRALKFNATGVVFSSFNRQNKKSKYTNDSQSKQLKNSQTQTCLVKSLHKNSCLCWAVQSSWFAWVNALCNLSRKKLQEVAASLPGWFLSRCCSMLCITVEIEPRIVKRYCCSCQKLPGKGDGGWEKVSLPRFLSD